MPVQQTPRHVCPEPVLAANARVSNQTNKSRRTRVRTGDGVLIVVDVGAVERVDVKRRTAALDRGASWRAVLKNVMPIKLNPCVITITKQAAVTPVGFGGQSLSR